MNQEQYFSQITLWKTFDLKNPISWWKFVSNQTEHKLLAEVAIRLFHIHPTNAAVERSFSVQNFIHRKDRNKITSERMNKLMSVYSNLRTFDSDKYFHEYDYAFESETEEEDEEDAENVIFLPNVDES